MLVSKCCGQCEEVREKERTQCLCLKKCAVATCAPRTRQTNGNRCQGTPVLPKYIMNIIKNKDDNN